MGTVSVAAESGGRFPFLMPLPRRLSREQATTLLPVVTAVHVPSYIFWLWYFHALRTVGKAVVTGVQEEERKESRQTSKHEGEQG